MVVDPNTGYYIRDLDKHWGSVVPKATGGLSIHWLTKILS
jgi:hypothetical protein